MNSFTSIDPAFGNIIAGLIDRGFRRLSIWANVENPRYPVYGCDTDLGKDTGAELGFIVRPASNDVDAVFGYCDVSQDDPEITERTAWRRYLNPFPWEDTWTHTAQFECDAFATYHKALETIDSFASAATFKRRVELSVDAGAITPAEADTRIEENWIHNQVYNRPLTPECHPFSAGCTPDPASVAGVSS